MSDETRLIAVRWEEPLPYPLAEPWEVHLEPGDQIVLKCADASPCAIVVTVRYRDAEPTP